MTTTWTPEQRAEYAKRLPRKRIVACLVAYHGGGLLAVKPTYREGWLLPGGTVEAGESPAAGCVRETWEELGLVLPIRQLLLVENAPDPGVHTPADADDGFRTKAMGDSGAWRWRIPEYADGS